jgi:choline monooxygenase
MPHALLRPVDFTAAERFEEELQRIFERSWVHVADLTDLPEPGAYVPAVIGRTPLLVMRGHDGEVRTFLNACPHRGATLAEAPGCAAPQLRCPYHAWSFASDGTLRGVPFREEFDCDLGQRNLVKVRTAQLGPLVFACLDAEAPPFAAWAGELGRALAAARMESWQAAYTFDYTVSVNWKVYVENGLDGYHIPFVHDVLAQVVDLGSGASTVEAHGSFTLVDPAPGLAPPEGGPAQFRFGHLFPNLIPVLTPIDFSYLRIDPVDAGTIRLRGRGFDAGPDTLVPREVRQAAFDQTNRQDIAVVERVQRGLRARRLAPAVHAGVRELRITHFEEMVRRAME